METLSCSLPLFWLLIFIKLLEISTSAAFTSLPSSVQTDCKYPKANGVEGLTSTVQQPDNQKLRTEPAKRRILACFENETVPMDESVSLPSQIQIKCYISCDLNYNSCLSEMLLMCRRRDTRGADCFSSVYSSLSFLIHCQESRGKVITPW